MCANNLTNKLRSIFLDIYFCFVFGIDEKSYEYIKQSEMG